LLQIRIWSRPEVFDQTEYALELASNAYRFYSDYFERPEIVPKAGTRSPYSSFWISFCVVCELCHSFAGFVSVSCITDSQTQYPQPAVRSVLIARINQFCPR